MRVCFGVPFHNVEDVIAGFKHPDILRELKAAADSLKAYAEAEKKTGNRIGTLRSILSYRKSKAMNVDPDTVDEMIVEIQDGVWRMVLEMSDIVTHLKNALELVPNEMPSTSAPAIAKPGVR